MTENEDHAGIDLSKKYGKRFHQKNSIHQLGDIS